MSLPSCKGQICSTRIQYSCGSSAETFDVVAVIEQVYMIQTVQNTIENPQLQYINNVTDDPVVKIVQIPRVRIMMKTNGIPQLQCIDESINDSGVEAPQVLIVQKTVEGSQLQWDMCS